MYVNPNLQANLGKCVVDIKYVENAQEPWRSKYIITVCVIYLQARSIRLIVREESWSSRSSWLDVGTASAHWTPRSPPASRFLRRTIRSSMRSSNSRRTSLSTASNCEAFFSAWLGFTSGLDSPWVWKICTFYSYDILCSCLEKICSDILSLASTKSQSEVSSTCRTRACWDLRPRTSPSSCTRRTDWTRWGVTQGYIIQHFVLEQRKFIQVSNPPPTLPCIHRLRWESSWVRTSSSTKKWCTAMWTSWTSAGGTLSRLSEHFWKASGCLVRPRRLTGWWRSLLLDTWSVIRGKASPLLVKYISY